MLLKKKKNAARSCSCERSDVSDPHRKRTAVQPLVRPHNLFISGRKEGADGGLKKCENVPPVLRRTQGTAVSAGRVIEPPREHFIGIVDARKEGEKKTKKIKD